MDLWAADPLPLSGLVVNVEIGRNRRNVGIGIKVVERKGSVERTLLKCIHHETVILISMFVIEEIHSSDSDINVCDGRNTIHVIHV